MMRGVAVVLAVGAIGFPGASAVQAQAADAAARAVAVRLVLDSTASVARYRVREQLARLDFPNDAVGETSHVEGVLALAADGAVVTDASRFRVELSTLTSDADRRDNYVRRRVLETEEYPSAVLVPTGLWDLPFPLPAAREATFQMVGDLTVHGVTRSTVWDVTATFGETAVSGTAATSFTFEEFGLEKPTVALVLSVADEIRLELDFRLLKEE